MDATAGAMGLGTVGAVLLGVDQRPQALCAEVARVGAVQRGLVLGTENDHFDVREDIGLTVEARTKSSIRVVERRQLEQSPMAPVVAQQEELHGATLPGVVTIHSPSAEAKERTSGNNGSTSASISNPSSSAL